MQKKIVLLLLSFSLLLASCDQFLQNNPATNSDYVGTWYCTEYDDSGYTTFIQKFVMDTDSFEFSYLDLTSGENKEYTPGEKGIIKSIDGNTIQMTAAFVYYTPEDISEDQRMSDSAAGWFGIDDLKGLGFSEEELVEEFQTSLDYSLSSDRTRLTLIRDGLSMDCTSSAPELNPPPNDENTEDSDKEPDDPEDIQMDFPGTWYNADQELKMLLTQTSFEIYGMHINGSSYNYLPVSKGDVDVLSSTEIDLHVTSVYISADTIDKDARLNGQHEGLYSESALSDLGFSNMELRDLFVVHSIHYIVSPDFSTIEINGAVFYSKEPPVPSPVEGSWYMLEVFDDGADFKYKLTFDGSAFAYKYCTDLDPTYHSIYEGTYSLTDTAMTWTIEKVRGMNKDDFINYLIDEEGHTKQEAQKEADDDFEGGDFPYSFSDDGSEFSMDDGSIVFTRDEVFFS